MCDLSKFIDICNIQARISDRLCIDELGVFGYRIFYLLEIIVLDIVSLDAERFQIPEKINRASVEA